MTEHTDIRQVLQECERKFLAAFRDSPLALTLTRASDHRYIEVNDTFERISGWNRDEVIGRTPFDIQIWVDPSQRVELVRRLLAGGTVRNLEVHARLKNRELWTGSGSAALVEINRETCVISLIADITDLKQADEAKQAAERLSRMGRRLIEAHEEERTAIARELHHYVDRLVLLAIDLDRLGQNPSDSVVARSRNISAARQAVEDLVIDIQALSRHLHSSELEHLGLATAAASLCKELSDQKNVAIDFEAEGIPENVPHAVSLCLFRVLQEALQHAVSQKSSSQEITVRLKGGPKDLSLAVSDWGGGFEAADPLNQSELDLTIMSERLKLVDGSLESNLNAKGGTTIRARVPLDAGIDSEGAAG